MVVQEADVQRMLRRRNSLTNKVIKKLKSRYSYIFSSERKGGCNSGRFHSHPTGGRKFPPHIPASGKTTETLNR